MIAGPNDRAKMLADNGLKAIGGFLPVVLHYPDVDPGSGDEDSVAGHAAADWCMEVPHEH